MAKKTKAFTILSVFVSVLFLFFASHSEAVNCNKYHIHPNSLPGGSLGTFYSAQLSTTGGAGATTFSLLSGTLPPPLTLSSSGLISGTPNALGLYAFTVQFQNSN